MAKERHTEVTNETH